MTRPADALLLPLKDPALLETRGLIGGAWTSGARSFAVTDPATGALVAEVADLDPKATETAIEAAYGAKKDWAAHTGKERAALLKRWSALMTEHADDLATILTAEMGKPLAEARGEVLYGAAYLEWFAEEAKRVYGAVMPGQTRDKRLMALKQPVGVVGSITPWNFPNAMIARKVGPALAAGCTFVARPSELTPLSALAMGVLAQRAGIPAGVFNIVPSLNAESVGRVLCAHPKVAKITFTGSTRVGRILMEQSAATIKKLSLELGGNAAFIVFDDGDLAAAVKAAMASKFRNNGQTCVSANRFFVQAGVYDDFAARLTKAVEQELTLGNGFDAGVTTGPMINEGAVRKVEAQIADATDQGARVLTGGARHDLGGSYFAPTVLGGVTPQMRIARQETFGPLAPLFRFETEDEVIAMANDTEFGLSSYFFSQNISRVWRMAEALEVGMVGINTGSISSETAPFGGIKQSGLGREGSQFGIDEYLEIKTLCFGEVG